MTFEQWWTKHGGMFSDSKQAAHAAWHARGPGGRVPIPDPDDAKKIMWCEPCVATVSCPMCESPAGVPCKGAALFMSRGHANGRRYVLTVHYARRDDHQRKKQEERPP